MWSNRAEINYWKFRQLVPLIAEGKGKFCINSGGGRGWRPVVASGSTPMMVTVMCSLNHPVVSSPPRGAAACTRVWKHICLVQDEGAESSSQCLGAAELLRPAPSRHPRGSSKEQGGLEHASLEWSELSYTCAAAGVRKQLPFSPALLHRVQTPLWSEDFPQYLHPLLFFCFFLPHVHHKNLSCASYHVLVSVSWRTWNRAIITSFKLVSVILLCYLWIISVIPMWEHIFSP